VLDAGLRQPDQDPHLPQPPPGRVLGYDLTTVMVVRYCPR
jgi:hypothetical protein